MARPLPTLLLSADEAAAAVVQADLVRLGYDVRVEVIDSVGLLRAELRVGGWELIVATEHVPFGLVDAYRIVREHDAEIPFFVVAVGVGEELVADLVRAGIQGFVQPGNVARLGPLLERELAAAADRRAAPPLTTRADLAAIVLSSSREGIAILDADLRVTTVNDAWLVVFRTVHEDIVGQAFPTAMAGYGDADTITQAFDLARRDGRWQGEVGGKLASGEKFSHWWTINAVRGADGRTESLVVVVADQTEVRSAEARVHYLAQYDVLTDLPNRNLLNERMFAGIAAGERAREAVAVLFVDVDRFKSVNDTFGHLLGDGLLRAVAGRLRSCARESDTVARVGGDEFVVFLPRAGAAVARTIALRILAAMASPFDIDGRRLYVSASVGAAVYPGDGTSPDQLISAADAALYQAKADGRNRLQFYTEAIDASIRQNVAIEHGLRDALRNGGFELVFQPQVMRETYKVLGAEALLRWRRPDGTLVSPAAFVRVAEETGLILPIGRWVLEESLRQVAAWRKEGLPLVRVSVNLSAVQFRQKNLAATVKSALEAANVPPSCLELELTETLLFEEARSDLGAIEELSALGVRWAVDDFGTGYSNLTYLKRFPISTLKIDKSFITDVCTDDDDAAIVRGIIGLAHNLRLEVIAEGVETAAQHHFLTVERCDAFQGYFFGRPVPARGMSEVLRVTGSRLGSTSTPRST